MTYTRISTDYENNGEVFWDEYREALDTGTVPEPLRTLAQAVLDQDNVYADPELATQFERWVNALPGFSCDSQKAPTCLLFYENEEADEDDLVISA